MPVTEGSETGPHHVSAWVAEGSVTVEAWSYRRGSEETFTIRVMDAYGGYLGTIMSERRRRHDE